jgi:hypothetical protein
MVVIAYVLVTVDGSTKAAAPVARLAPLAWMAPSPSTVTVADPGGATPTRPSAAIDAATPHTRALEPRTLVRFTV